MVTEGGLSTWASYLYSVIATNYFPLTTCVSYPSMGHSLISKKNSNMLDMILNSCLGAVEWITPATLVVTKWLIHLFHSSFPFHSTDSVQLCNVTAVSNIIVFFTPIGLTTCHYDPYCNMDHQFAIHVCIITHIVFMQRCLLYASDECLGVGWPHWYQHISSPSYHYSNY